MKKKNQHRTKNPKLGTQKNDKESRRSDSSFVRLITTSRDISPYLGLGVQLAASILVFLFLGRWVDGKLGTEPLFMLIGAFIGAAGGMLSFIRAVLKQDEKMKREKQKHKN